jgi:hypothetical protein
MHRLISARSLGLLALAFVIACGRGTRAPRGPAVPITPTAVDTAAARQAAEQRARADSLRADSLRTDSIRVDSLRKDSLRLAKNAAPPAPPGAKGRPKQERRCQLNFPNTPASRVFLVKDAATNRYNTFVGGGVVGKCAGQDVTLYADSAEFYDTIKLYYLFGNVRYREARVNIDADRVTYFLQEERILAEQNVRATLPSGSSMTGPEAEYLRPVAPIRTVAQLKATRRPTFKLVQKDSTGKPSDPATLVANRVNVVDDSAYYAGGDVDITRPDIHATSDSAYMAEVRQYARLIRRPQIEGKGERKFTLRGRAIDLFSKNRLLERVLSVDSANAISGDLDLRSDSIDMRVTDNKLTRAYAWGPTRAKAVSPDRTILADSLDVQMPNQRVSEVHAIGSAYAETTPDSTKLKSEQRDWLKGDTIVAAFDSALASDTSSRPRIKQLVADGNASSFYQIPSNKGPTERPSLNYVRGKSITVSFLDQEVQSVIVDEQAAGVFLEPVSDTTAAGKARQQRPGTPAPGAVRPPARPNPIRPSPGNRDHD